MSGPPSTSVRPAATVVLLRANDVPPGAPSLPGTEPFQVFVLRRVTGMAFAGGMTVFPGGGVDPGDHAPVQHWAGPPPSWWVEILGRPDAASVVVAAVRELFEEAGVLLAGPERTGPQPQPPGGVADLAAAREELLTGRLGLPDVLARRGWWLRADLLRPLANWVTPVGQTRRYDTVFFLAALPVGQDADLLTTEADCGHWDGPARLLAQARAGALEMLPPTRAMLGDLLSAGSVEDALAVPRSIVPVHPTPPPTAAVHDQVGPR